VTINIISTVNGLENEGMRNVASHMIKELEGICSVRRSALGNPMECVKNSIGADAVLVFARASAKTAYLAKAVRLFCKRVYFILVQKPESVFIKKLGKGIKKFAFFTTVPEDADEVRSLGCDVYPLSIGINKMKFRPAESVDEKAALRKKYGFEVGIPLVLHVGHLSQGRGLEDFLQLPKGRFQRLIVASGMFNGDEVEKTLLDDGVTILKEYLPDVSEVYRMADVYLFPTKSAEFVISVPLSVMEALSCGIPVVAYDKVAGIRILKEHTDHLYYVGDASEIEAVTDEIINRSHAGCMDLLADIPGWSDAAKELYDVLSEKCKSH